MENKEYIYRVNFYSNENYSVNEYLQNKNILCLKEIVDRDFSTKIKANEVVNITSVSCDIVRGNTIYLEIYFTTFNKSDKIDLYLDIENNYTLLSHIKSLFLPINNLYELWSLK